MVQGSTIEWTESTWNPVTGCTKVSPGCRHCYAERMAERLRAMGQANYASGFELTLQPHMLEVPLAWKKPQTVRELDERPLSQRCAIRVHQARLRRHETSLVASLSGAHQEG
jgi:hypothetical protein